MNPVQPKKEIHERFAQLLPLAATIYDVNTSDIVGIKRDRRFCYAREAIFTRMWHEGYRQSDIGALINRSHPTVSHSISQLTSRINVASWEDVTAKWMLFEDAVKQIDRENGDDFYYNVGVLIGAQMGGHRDESK